MDEGSNQETDQGGTLEKGASDQAEVDPLMQGAGDTSGESGDAGEAGHAGDALAEAANAAQGEEAAPQAESGAVTQADVDAMLSASGASAMAEGAKEVTTEPAIAEEGTAAQDAPASSDAGAATASEPDTRAFQLANFGGEQPDDIDSKRVTMLNDVDLHVKLQLGKTRMLVEDVLGLREGSVVELDKLAGDPIDVLINDRLIARGEVLVLNDVFCVRVSEVLAHDPHRVTT
ncbi:MAG: flagellar motor switch protein FliN [Planctomycetota bacterium]|jgi:flagellar motor switch protein FliN/FliY